MEPQGGKAPLVIEFWDMSSGDPTSWDWWVIPEGGDKRPVEGGKEISYQFTEAGNYTVRLRVNNELGADEAEKSFVIGEPEIVEEPEDEEEQEEPGEEDEPLPPPPEYNADSFVFRNYDHISPNVPYSTGISTDDYNCAIVSMKAIQGNLACNNYEDIMDAYLKEGNDDKWEIHANIRTHNNHERWSMGVMCVDKDKSMTVEAEFTPSDVPDEGYSLEGKGIPGNYTCVISGFDIGYGSPANKGAGDIIKVFTRKTEGNWHVTADFFNDGNDEEWEVYVMCFYRDPDLFFDYEHWGRMRITDYQPVAFNENTFSEKAIKLNGIDSRRYACGVAGMEAVNGTIECEGSHNLIESYTFVDRDKYKWYAYANFYSRGSGEEWNLDLICVDRSIVDIDMSKWVVLWPDR
jgi:PKD repeat protein